MLQFFLRWVSLVFIIYLSIHIFFHVFHWERHLEEMPLPANDQSSSSLDEDEILPSPMQIKLMKPLEVSSNLPMEYWSRIASHNFPNTICTKFPNLFNLDFNNVYWQTLRTEIGSFYLYSAYFDDRFGVGELPYVRVLAMIDKTNPPKTYCQFWYDDLDEKPIFSYVSHTFIMAMDQNKTMDGILQPVLLSCAVPRSVTNSAPVSVSIVEKPCDTPKNSLRIVNNRPSKKQDFAVCVKGLDFLHEDISLRLVEWIELLRILGVKKIFMYELEVHANISKVLSHYVRQGLVDVTPITLPGNQPNLPGFRHLYLKSKILQKRQNEVIPYNDCLYRNLYSYDYIVPLDVDEIIMPRRHKNWSDLLTELERLSLKYRNMTSSHYDFRNVYFFDRFSNVKKSTYKDSEQISPNHLHMLHHVYRSRMHSKPKEYVKSFNKVEKAIAVGNHKPSRCFETCTYYSINPVIAHLQHYRKDCVHELQEECEKYRTLAVRDANIIRYKHDLMTHVMKSLQEIGFINFHKIGSSDK